MFVCCVYGCMYLLGVERRAVKRPQVLEQMRKLTSISHFQ